jgi:hypothetical protein
MLEVRSFYKVQPMDDTTACLLSAFIALDEDSDDEMEDAAAGLVSLDFSLNFCEFRLNHPKFIKFQ